MSGKQFLVALMVMGCMAAGGAFAAVAVFMDMRSANAAPGDTLRASALEIVDAKGKVRARLASEANGDVALRLLDAEGAKRAEFAYLAGKDRLVLKFLDAKGGERWLSALTSKNECLLAFAGAGKAKFLTLLAGPELASSVLLQDPQSKRALTAFAGRGQSTLQLSDAQGRMGLLGSVIKDGRSVLGLAKDGKLRLRAMTTEDTTPEIKFLDDQRKATWSAGK